MYILTDGNVPGVGEICANTVDPDDLFLIFLNIFNISSLNHILWISTRLQ